MPQKKIKSIAAILQIVLGLILVAILGVMWGLPTGDLAFLKWIYAQRWYPWNAAWAAIAVVAAIILVSMWKDSDAHDPQEKPPAREDLDAALRKAFEGLVVIARQNGWVPPQIMKDKEAEIAKLTDQLRGFQHQLASSSDPAESKLSQCLEAGDLDAALREASQQVENVLKEAGKLPRDLYVLGAIHEFRFEWPDALTACRRAWQLSKDPDHGFKYAYMAQKLHHFSEAIAAYQALLLVYSDPAQRATALNNLGLLYHATQSMNQAEEAFAQALAACRKLAQANPDAWLPDIATTLNNLADLYGDTQRIKQAEEAYGEALDLRRKLAQDNPSAYLPDVATTLNNLANLYSDTQRMNQAEEAYAEALAAYRKLAQANPDAYRPDVAATLDNLANLYCATQRMNQAEEAYTEALGIRRNLAQANPEAFRPDVATTLDNLANLYGATQRMNQAEWAHTEALGIRRKLAQANPDAFLPCVSTTLNNLACFCFSAGRIPEAETHASGAESILDPFWQANPELHGNLMAKILWTRALVSEASQQPAAEACALARRALAAAYDPALKQSTQQLIDRTRPASQSPAP
jgi:tetratricopeptide (TPR) repeat protein